MVILVVDKMHELFYAIMQNSGAEVIDLPASNRADIIKHLPRAQGLVIRSKTPVDEQLLGHAPQLKFIARAGAGIDNIDERATAARSIVVINAPEGNRDAVAEQMCGMLLSLVNNVVRGHQEVLRGEWVREANRGHEIGGKTVGLVGFGHNGEAMAKRLQAFGCRVLAVDPYKAQWPEGLAEKSSWGELFEAADILSLHVPLTGETAYLIDHPTIARFRKPIWLLNGSRGKVVQLSAVLEGLESGKLRGAALDVMENENPRQWTADYRATVEKLAQTGRVIFTPHVAGWTFESHQRISTVLADKIVAYWQNAGNGN